MRRRYLSVGLILAASMVIGVGAAQDVHAKASVKWKDGFRIVDDREDGDFYYLRLRLALQFRYTYLAFDDAVCANQDADWNNFYFRRLRIFIDGQAPTKDWRYLVHIQLEPTSNVNTHDGWVQWQRFDFLRCRIGRMKIPYGLTFFQSGFGLNGVERTIFSGETDVDGKAKDLFGNRIGRFWPGGNAAFPVGGHLKGSQGTRFPTGGLILYRSQGVELNGDLAVGGLREEGTLHYWAGVFNGRDTSGMNNSTMDVLYTIRLAYAPLGTFDLVRQGDWPGSETLKAALFVSAYYYEDEAQSHYDLTNDQDDPDDDYVDVDEGYMIRDFGYNLAVIVRYRGFSADLEYGFEEFALLGTTPETRGMHDRLGGRVNFGYFFVPRTWEAVFKWAYLERIHGNDPFSSLQTGLGLVETEAGDAVERDLRQYTVGVNRYLRGHSFKICVDLSFLVRRLEGVDPADRIEDQHDYRFRAMIQYVF